MAKSNYENYTHAQLVEELKKLSKRKKYGLVWEEEKTKEKFEADAESKLPVLVEDKKREIKTDADKPTHILIEGDNYHALSVLNYTHAKSIDVIYIDPPYNTGARDWKYNNDFVEDEDAFRHSKWLSFMNNRLKLSKKLLKPKGVLICTIDENEHATLGLLLQEIFSDREIVCVTIVHNPGGIQGKNFSYCHEYAYFVHPKNGTFISKIRRDDIDPVPLRDWGKESAKRESAKNCFFPIYVKDEKVIGFGEVCLEKFHPKESNILRKDGVTEIYPIDKNGIERKWRFSRQSIEGIRDELICKRMKDELVIVRDKKDYRWKTVWTDGKYNANVYGTKLLNNIIEINFPFPKSIYAVIDCIRAVTHNKDKSTILDFFAGSGTTGHAVLELNKEDGGKRQFILCTNNENNICTEVCYPRVKKVIQGYKSTKGEKTEGLGGNLKYYKTNFVGSEPTHRNKKLLTDKSIEMLCIKENTFDEVINKKDFFIFKSKEKFTAILFNEIKINEFKDEIKKLKMPVSVYVFSLEGDDFKEEFENLKNDITLCSIPEAILKVYRRIYGAGQMKLKV
ncbi:MAG: site-specific DNA-methyltransferase [Nitrospinae bacterium]|nr:site-specific DNA-methyltransferase [Nitrospinota bacterium]